MRKRDTNLSTDQKALAINLDKLKYGSIVEIGAGQEVARRFFSVGAAAGTIAKTMSAYDMAVSDDIYGQADRYVSRSRMLQMLDKEFDLVVQRLTDVRPKNTTFFAYAATVTARSFKQKNECHGWVGMRVQLHPGAEPSDVIMHVRMLDNDNALQSEALGILGVNLIHGVFNYFQHPEWVVESLADGLEPERIEVDVIHFSGPYFEEVENRLMNLHLISSWLTRAVIFNPNGEVVVPGELFYRKPVMVMRGTFKPVNAVNVDMMCAGQKQFAQLEAVDEKDVVSLAEITMNSLVSGDNIDGADFLARIDLLASQGYTVMISDYLRFFRLRAYLRRYTQKPIGIVLSVRDFAVLFDEKYYEGMEGGDGVDVLRGVGEGDVDPFLPALFDEFLEQVVGAVSALVFDDAFERVQPFAGFLRVGVRLQADFLCRAHASLSSPHQIVSIGRVCGRRSGAAWARMYPAQNRCSTL
jgi:hypothetical protein